MTDSEQADLTWHKSTASNVNGACVEVAFADNSVLVRNSRDPLVSVLSFTYQEWAAFLKGVNNGEFTPNQASNNPLTFRDLS